MNKFKITISTLLLLISFYETNCNVLQHEMTNNNQKLIKEVEFYINNNYILNIKKDKNDSIYREVDEMPDFIGGRDSLLNYIENSINYPKTAQEDSIEGKVIIGFVIDTNGVVRNPRVVRGLSNDINNECMKSIRSMPRWKPGKLKGENVNVYYKLSIKFDLPYYYEPLKLTVSDVPFKYVITNKELNVIYLSGMQKGKTDTILFSAKLQSSRDIKVLRNLNIDSLKEEYRNPCVIDGTEFTVTLQKYQNTKTIHVSNFYQQDIAHIINLINRLTPKKYSIGYNKEDLLKDQNDCEELEDLK